MSNFRIGRTVLALEPTADDAIDEVAARVMEELGQYGTSDPDSNTPGSIYFKHGSSTSDSVTVFVKVGGEWYGG